MQSNMVDKFELKMCKRCFTMKNIRGKKEICKRCEDELDEIILLNDEPITSQEQVEMFFKETESLRDKILEFKIFGKMFKEEDVKEFIRRLKEEVFKSQKKHKINYPIGNYFYFIDKLAGDKLNGN